MLLGLFEMLCDRPDLKFSPHQLSHACHGRALLANPSGQLRMSKVRLERLLADDQEPKTTPTAKIPTLQSTPEAALVAALAS